jgi:hypothetical protein
VITNRKTARIVGVLYIIGTVAGILSLVFMGPIRDAQDVLIGVSANENRVITGALIILVMGLALAMVPVMMFPILRKQNEALALGYVVFRGGLETVTSIATAISWLSLLTLSRAYVQAGAPDAATFQALGTLLLEAEEIESITTIVFPLGALMFYYLLYQSRLIPRWLSGWGLIAALLWLTTGLAATFGLISRMSTIQVVLALPIAVQEMVLAVWLIVKGFNPSAIASESAKTV